MGTNDSDDNIEVDATAPTDTYRSEDYDRFAEPDARPTGEAAPSETVEYRSYDHDQIERTVGTVGTAAPSTKAVKPTSADVSTKVVKPADPTVGKK